MTRKLLFIASISLFTATRVSAQGKGQTRTVVVENKEVTTTRSSCTEACSHANFFDFFRELKTHEGFDSEKLREAKMAAGADCFTSHQIKITLTAFTYEETRIEFAKFAYKYVYDKDKYAEIKGGFNKASSWDEVNEFINHK